MGDENQGELKLDVCEITPVVIAKTGHFMNSVLNTSHIYSYAVDSFFDVTSCFFPTFIKFDCEKYYNLY